MLSNLMVHDGSPVDVLVWEESTQGSPPVDSPRPQGACDHRRIEITPLRSIALLTPPTPRPIRLSSHISLMLGQPLN